MLNTIIGARCLYLNCQRATPNDLLVKWLNCQSAHFLRLTDHWQFNKSTKMVEVNGLEPMASCVQGRRSPSWATPPRNDNRFRTQVSGFQLLNPESKSKFGMVGLDGVEPSTSRLSGVRSNQAELQAPGDFGSRYPDLLHQINSKIQLSPHSFSNVREQHLISQN